MLQKGRTLMAKWFLQRNDRQLVQGLCQIGGPMMLIDE